MTFEVGGILLLLPPDAENVTYATGITLDSLKMRILHFPSM